MLHHSKFLVRYSNLNRVTKTPEVVICGFNVFYRYGAFASVVLLFLIKVYIMDLPVVSLKARRNSLHPWIFDRMIRHPRKTLKAGSLVEVISREGEFIGRGIYNHNSNIGIRLLTENISEMVGREFFHHKLETARALREEILGIGKTSNCYRLIHGEADGLSGLIIDKFADVFVVEPYSAGYIEIMGWISSSLKTLYPGCRIVVRPDERTAAKRECRLFKGGKGISRPRFSRD